MADKKTHKKEVDVVEKARGFWEDYSKQISYIGSAIILLVGAWLVYKYMFKKPEQEKADKIVFVTQKYFTQFTNATDSAKILMATKVLNGDGSHPGALKIITNIPELLLPICVNIMPAHVICKLVNTKNQSII